MEEEINTTPVGRSSNNQKVRTPLAEALGCLVSWSAIDRTCRVVAWRDSAES
jgi:hypothetical protein